ncbi:MAG: ATP synthase F1 subunit epsilon [Pseudomonadota bacterium]
MSGSGKKLRLTITTPERLALDRDVDSVVIPAARGQLGVLPGHLPFMVELSAGVLKIRSDDERDFFAISGGFAEIKRDSVAIFAETAELSDEIDVERARQALERARNEAHRKALEPLTLFQAEAEALRAAVWLRVAQLRKTPRKPR